MPEHTWTAADDAAIRQHYASMRVDLLAASLGITRQQLYWRARKKLGLGKAHSGGGKGCPSPRAAPVGTTRKSAGYWFVKVAHGRWPRAWRQVHHVAWEAAHGPIPPDHVLAFRDGNVDNLALENLALFSKSEWVAQRVHIEGRLPPALAQVIRIKAVLTRQINKTTKEMHEQQS